MLLPGGKLTEMVLWLFPTSVTWAFTTVSWLFVDTSRPGSSASGGLRLRPRPYHEPHCPCLCCETSFFTARIFCMGYWQLLSPLDMPKPVILQSNAAHA